MAKRKPNQMDDRMAEARRVLLAVVSDLHNPDDWEVTESGTQVAARRGECMIGFQLLPPGRTHSVLAFASGAGSLMPHALTMNAGGTDLISLIAFVQSACAVLSQDAFFVNLRGVVAAGALDGVTMARMGRSAPKADA